MPVIEITQLRLKGATVDDPVLIESLSLVRGRLQTDSRFFSCIGDSSLIYIFGVWPSLNAHLEFLASPARDEVLGPQEDILDFQWTIHLELVTISPSLLEAPFIAIQRLEVDLDHAHVYNEVLDEHVRTLQTEHHSNVMCAWRCDMPKGSDEAVILASWFLSESGDAEEGRPIAFNSDDNVWCREILFHHAQNMEYKQPKA